MATLIVYRTKHGTTKRAVQLLEQHVEDRCVLIDLKVDEVPDLASFDTVVIGGSIHMGSIQASVKHFAKKYQAELLKKAVGLFICHYEEGTLAEEEFARAYPERLRSHALAAGFFGGEFNVDKMNFLWRKMTLAIGKNKVPPSRFKPKRIAAFAAALNNAAKQQS